MGDIFVQSIRWRTRLLSRWGALGNEPGRRPQEHQRARLVLGGDDDHTRAVKALEEKPVKLIFNVELQVSSGARHGKCSPLKGK